MIVPSSNDDALFAAMSDVLEHAKANLSLCGVGNWRMALVVFHPDQRQRQSEFLVIGSSEEERLQQEIAGIMNPQWGPDPDDQSTGKPINEIFRIGWENEDELPQSLTDEQYNAMFSRSRVDVVRLFPYIEDIAENRFYLSSSGLIPAVP